MSKIEVGILIPGQGIEEHDPEKSIRTVVNNYNKLLDSNPRITPKFILPNSFGLYAGIAIGVGFPIVIAIKTAYDRRKLVSDGEEMRVQEGLERTGMVAILGQDLNVVRRLAEQHGIDITNINGSVLHVVGGIGSSLNNLRTEVEKTVRLGVNGVYHSTIRNRERDAYRQLLEPVQLGDTEIPIIVSTDPRIVTKGEELKYELIEQLARHVDLTKAAELVDEFEVRYLIDIGTDGTMTKICKRLIRGGVEILDYSNVLHREKIKSLK